jgi:hypothetical protein
MLPTNLYMQIELILNGNGGNYMLGLGNPLVWKIVAKTAKC